MNAPATEAQVSALPIDALVPSKSHVQELRRARFTDESIKDLAKNIGEVGIVQQPLVRPLGDGKFEIIAGERRWRAAKLLGLKAISCNVRTLTDSQALLMQLSENLEREDLHALEEAEGYEELMKVSKVNVDQVAEMIGASRSTVYARTKLLALCPEARKAFYEGGMDASTALLVARIPHADLQRRAIKDLEIWRRDGDIENFKDAQRCIHQHYMLTLKKAPFDIKDANLVPKAGSCEKCPKRTGNQRELFGDVKDADVCTDPKCFDDKRQAHYAGARKKLEAEGKKVIHGDGAKKIFPDWEEGEDYTHGAYKKLDQTTYVGGNSRKVKDVLGPDYEPILVQHPLSGKIIELATEQAIAAASQSAKGSGRSSGAFNYSAHAARQKAKGPDVDQEEMEALVRLIHQKAPKKFGRREISAIALRVAKICNARRYGQEALTKAWGWPTSAYRSGYYSKQLPAQASAFDENKLLLFIFDALFVNCYGMERKPLLDLFGISEAKVRDEVIELRKKKQKEEREAARAKKLAKAPKTKPPAKAKRGKHDALASFMKPMYPSPTLAVITGAGALSRTDVTKKVWGYIKRNGLQDKKNRRFINSDSKLLPVFGGKKQLSMFEMTKALSKHLSTKPPAGAQAWPFPTGGRLVDQVNAAIDKRAEKSKAKKPAKKKAAGKKAKAKKK